MLQFNVALDAFSANASVTDDDAKANNGSKSDAIKNESNQLLFLGANSDRYSFAKFAKCEKCPLVCLALVDISCIVWC